ncbi:YihY/virulence factor BrkB family protein [Pseudolysinimonas sp.]|jgi:membrane protein|uniref:YihY/virulence factor BrkB family protein n=1 Tax=Pseudolysinimonas sp. TaxID=2680009 RepID=UPI003784F1B1
MALKDTITAAVAWVQRRKPVRVVVRYGQDRGPILASGMAYQALFAVFAGLWVGFSIAGLVVSRDAGLQQVIVDALDQAVPGLIAADGPDSGAIDPEDLPTGIAFSISGLIAVFGLLFTALGWLASARDSVRTLFDLPPATTNPVLQKLVDLGLGAALASLLLVAAGLSFAGTTATEFVLEWLDIDTRSVVGFVLSRTVTLVVAVIVYGLALAGIYRLLAGVKVPARILRHGVTIGAIGLAVLTVLGGLLLGGAQNNPLIASFAVVAGLLIYYNFASQVILIAATWMAVDVADEGIVIDEKVFASRLEAARALVAAHEPEPEPENPGFFARLFRRRGR